MNDSINRSHCKWTSAAVITATFLGLTGISHAASVEDNWSKHCASCHGKDGKGETKAGRKAGVKDQTDPKYQLTLVDDKMIRAIIDGLKENGKEKMKPFRDKLSDAEANALAAHVRSFKK